MPLCIGSCCRKFCAFEKLLPHCRHVCLRDVEMTESKLRDLAVCKHTTFQVIVTIFHKILVMESVKWMCWIVTTACMQPVNRGLHFSHDKLLWFLHGWSSSAAMLDNWNMQKLQRSGLVKSSKKQLQSLKNKRHDTTMTSSSHYDDIFVTLPSASLWQLCPCLCRLEA